MLSILLKGTGVAFLPNQIAKPYIGKGILNEIKMAIILKIMDESKREYIRNPKSHKIVIELK